MITRSIFTHYCYAIHWIVITDYIIIIYRIDIRMLMIIYIYLITVCVHISKRVQYLGLTTHIQKLYIKAEDYS